MSGNGYKFESLPHQFNPRTPAPNNLKPPDYVEPDRGYRWKPTRSWHLSGEFCQQNVDHNSRWWLFENRWRTAPAWAGRQPGFFKRQNSFFTPYGLVLRARREPAPVHLQRKGYWGYSTSFVRSKSAFTYGYCEIACKLGDSTISSAFWLKEVPRWVAPGIKLGKREREIDMFEYSTSTIQKPWKPNSIPFSHMFHMNTHWYHDYNSMEKRGHDNVMERYVDCETNLSKERVIKVGIYWGRDRICWYLNDKKVREERAGDYSQPFIKEGHFKQFNGTSGAPPKMHIQFDRETMFGFFGQPGKNDNMWKPEGDFKIFYCRTWEMEPTWRPQGRQVPRFLPRAWPTRQEITSQLENDTSLSAGLTDMQETTGAEPRGIRLPNRVTSMPRRIQKSWMDRHMPKSRAFGNGWST